jgi:hypothetical protein
MQASWPPTVSKGHLLAVLGLVWLLIACVWLYTYSTAPLFAFVLFFLAFSFIYFLKQYNVAATSVGKEAKDETEAEAEEPALAFPLVLKGMHNANRACESLLSLTYNSMQCT